MPLHNGTKSKMLIRALSGDYILLTRKGIIVRCSSCEAAKRSDGDRPQKHDLFGGQAAIGGANRSAHQMANTDLFNTA